MDQQRFYVVLDTNFLIDFLRTEVAFLKKAWSELGRPTITFVVMNNMLGMSSMDFAVCSSAMIPRLVSVFIVSKPLVSPPQPLPLS